MLKRLLPLGIILGSVLTVSAQTSQTGKLMLSQGTVYLNESTVQVNNTTEAMGQSIEMAMTVNTTQKATVASAAGGKYTVQVSTERIAMNVAMMGQSKTFDSDKKEDMESEGGKEFAGALHQVTEIDVMDDGRIEKITKPKNAEGEAAASPAGMIPGMSAADDGTQGFSNMILVIPASIKEGDQWSDSVKTDKAKVVRNYKLTKISGVQAEITISGTQSISQNVEQMGMEMTVNLEGKFTGSATVDLETGVVVTRQLVTDATGSTDVMGQSMPMTMKTTTTSTIRKQ